MTPQSHVFMTWRYFGSGRLLFDLTLFRVLDSQKPSQNLDNTTRNLAKQHGELRQQLTKSTDIEGFGLLEQVLSAPNLVCLNDQACRRFLYVREGNSTRSQHYQLASPYTDTE